VAAAVRTARLGLPVVLAALLALAGAGDAWAGPGDLFREAEELKAADAGRHTLVDVRPASLFAAYHIPGSINVEPFALKTNPFFRRKEVVLVAETLSLCRLLQIRENLKTHGFAQVRILRGGVTAWEPLSNRDALAVVTKYLLQGARECREISPVVLDLRDEKAFAQRSLPGAINLPFGKRSGEGTEPFLKKAERVLDPQAGRDPARPLVLVDDRGALPRLLVLPFKKEQRPFTFSLQGGTRDWFLEQDYPPGEGTTQDGSAGSGQCGSCP